MTLSVNDIRALEKCRVRNMSSERNIIRTHGCEINMYLFLMVERTGIKHSTRCSLREVTASYEAEREQVTERIALWTSP